MESFGSNRSLPLIVGVLLALAIGLGALYSLDVASGHDDFYEEDISVSYSEAEIVMSLDGKGWLRNLTLVGAVVAAVSAVAFSKALDSLQGILITLGSLAAMGGPIWVISNLDGANPGPGLIVAMVCFAIAAVLPWVLMVFGKPKAVPQYQS